MARITVVEWSLLRDGIQRPCDVNRSYAISSENKTNYFNIVLKPHGASTVHKSSKKANYPPAPAPDTLLTPHKEYPIWLLIPLPWTRQIPASTYHSTRGYFPKFLRAHHPFLTKCGVISYIPRVNMNQIYILTATHIPVPIHLYSLLSLRSSMSLTALIREVSSLAPIRRDSNFLSYQSILRVHCASAGQCSSSSSTYEDY